MPASELGVSGALEQIPHNSAHSYRYRYLSAYELYPMLPCTALHSSYGGTAKTRDSPAVEFRQRLPSAIQISSARLSLITQQTTAVYEDREIPISKT